MKEFLERFSNSMLKFMEKTRNFALLRRKSCRVLQMVKGENKEVAGFNRRIFAMTIDMLLIVILITPISGYLIKASNLEQKVANGLNIIEKGEKNSKELKRVKLQVLGTFLLLQSAQVALIFAFLYAAHVYLGRTPGKILFRCKIIDLDTEQTIGNKKMLIRLLACVPSLAPLGIGLLFILFSKRNQALHDMMVRTVVIVDKSL